MLNPRIIPCLLVQNNGLVKTVRFGNPKYVGDPINAVKIFNEKEVDELIVLDIEASARKRTPNFTLIEHLAAECRMPLCYGGGIKTVEQATRIFGLGVEKIAVSSLAVENPSLISVLAGQVGNQSVVAVIDVKKSGRGTYEIYTDSGRNNTRINPFEYVKKLESMGVGEIVVNSIDNDGIMKGYDFELIDGVFGAVSVPLTVLGGAGSLDDIGALIRRYGIIGASAGSLFVFKGVYRAVLINYPRREKKDTLIRESFGS